MSQPSGAAAVEALYSDYDLLTDELATRPSGLAAINRAYAKHLLLAAASSLEAYVKESVPRIFAEHGNPQMGQFVTKWVFARGYHTLFDWKNRTAQQFFGSFGPVCGTGFKAALRENSDFKKQHDAFMLLGSLRNEIVHNDFATRSIDLTPEEIIENYRHALQFIDYFEHLIHIGDA